MDRFDLAAAAACECAVLANGVLSALQSPKSPIKREADDQAQWGQAEVSALYLHLLQANPLIATVERALQAANHGKHVRVGERTYPCACFAGYKIAFDVFHHAWSTIDPDGYADGVFDGDAIQRNWWSGADRRREWAELGHEATIEFDVDEIKSAVMQETAAAAIADLATGRRQEASVDASPSSEHSTSSENIEERAVSCLLTHQNWSDKQVAESIGVNPKYLASKREDGTYRFSKYRAMRTAMRSEAARSIPRGSKVNRTVEAFGDE